MRNLYKEKEIIIKKMKKEKSFSNEEKLKLDSLNDMIKVIDVCCEFFNVSKEDLYKKPTKRMFTDAKHIVLYIFVKELKLTGRVSGDVFGLGSADVFLSIKKIKNIIITDNEFRALFREILAQVKKVPQEVK